jgi:exopolysaccharide biosynthesis polyprenyl glycosylphosphotransferase
VIPDTRPRLRAPFSRRPPRHRDRPLRRGLLDAPGSASLRQRDRIFRRSLVVADFLVAAGALLVAVPLLEHQALRPAALLVPFIAVLVSKAIGLYDHDELVMRKSTLDETGPLLQLTSLYTILVWLLAPVLTAGSLGRPEAASLWARRLVGSLVARGAARAVARRWAPDERCLVVGGAESGEWLARQMAMADTGTHTKVVGQVRLDDVRDLQHSLDSIESAVREHDVHRILLAPRRADTDGVLDAIRLAKALGVKVSLLPRVFEVVGSAVEFDELNGLPVLGLRRFGLTRSSWALKHAMDWTGATLLCALLSPLIVLIAVAIRLDTPGPVFFRQTRVGRDGRRFQIFKFRTMVDDAEAMKESLLERNEAQGLFKMAEDPRVTRVGRWLRKTSLDEIPQLFNVLRGEMSLVGPRPLVVDEDDKVRGWDRRRLQLTPGMTGQWQILGSSRIPLDQMVKIDYLYVANWSLWGDVKILVRTIPYLLRGRGM